MNDSIMIKSGSLNDRTTMPNLAEDELGYRKDEKALYIGANVGDKTTNLRLCGADDIAEIARNSQKILNLEKELISFNTRISENAATINNHQKEIDTNEKEINSLKSKAENFVSKEYVDGLVSDINAHLDTINSLIAMITGEITTINGKINTINSRLDAMLTPSE